MEESDEAEGGSQATQGRLLVGVELGHGAGRLPPAALGQPLGPRIAHRPAPDPTGLGAALTALGTNNIFRDLTGLALNQQNAADALKTSLSAAQGFATKAGALAQQRFLNQELDRSLGHIKAARDKQLISNDQASAISESALRGAIARPARRPRAPSSPRRSSGRWSACPRPTAACCGSPAPRGR